MSVTDTFEYDRRYHHEPLSCRDPSLEVAHFVDTGFDISYVKLCCRRITHNYSFPL